MYLNKTINSKIFLAALFVICYLLFATQVRAASPPVALDWQADTYTPAWYAGKKLPVRGGDVFVSATMLAPEILTKGTKTKAPTYAKYYYKWYLNGQRISDWKLDDAKFQFTAKDSSSLVEMRLGKKTTKTLPFTNKKMEFISEIGQYRTIIQSHNPSVVVYTEESGVLTYGGETAITSGSEKNFLAIPYFYTIAKISDLKFDWSFLGNSISGASDKPNELLLKIKENSAQSSASLSVRVMSSDEKQETKEIKVKIE